jgi:hypothetical protein
MGAEANGRQIAKQESSRFLKKAAQKLLVTLGCGRWR